MLLQADASQLEWRVCLELSDDLIGIQEVLNLEDTHSLNQVAFNLPSRLISKIYLFRTIFNRGKGYAFTVDPKFMHVSTSVKYWDEVGHKFYSKYAGIAKLYDTNLALVGNGKPLIGPLGREWPIGLVKNSYTGLLEPPVTLVVNYPVQGTGADIMTLVRISFFNRIKKKEYAKYVKFVSTVHDSIVLDLPKELVKEVSLVFHQVFADLPANIMKIFGYSWKVPLACEVKYGSTMAEMEKE